MPRVVLIVVALALACSTLAVPASAGPDNGLACSLVSISKTQKAFGLQHAKSQSVAKSPTAGSAGGNQEITVDGSDESICNLFLYSGSPPSKATLKTIFTSPFKAQIPAGIGLAIVTTNVRDHTPPGSGHGWDGESWDAGTYYTMLVSVAAGLKKRYGGGIVPGTGGSGEFTAKDSYLIWIGNKDHAIGMFQLGDGVIQVQVVASGGTAPEVLTEIADRVVPKFNGFAGS